MRKIESAQPLAVAPSLTSVDVLFYHIITAIHLTHYLPFLCDSVHVRDGSVLIPERKPKTV